MEFILAEHARRSADTPKVAILGMAFKGVPATDDLRGSMSVHVLKALRDRAPEAKVTLFDAVCTPEQLTEVAPDCEIADTMVTAIAGANVAIIANNHPKLADMRPRQMLTIMAKDGFLYDYWNHFSDLRPYELGPSYFAVGNTGGHSHG